MRPSFRLALSPIALAIGSLLVSPVRAQTVGSIESLDLAIGTGSSNAVFTVAQQPDAKLVIAGNFSTVLGESRTDLARINADGSLDPTFAPTTNTQVTCLAVQVDGKILVGGSFNLVNSVNRSRLARLNPDGSLDLTFDPKPLGEVYGIIVQPDGKILICGSLHSLQPIGDATATQVGYIARLNPDGSIDPGFSNINANLIVQCMALQPDGRIVIGGQFSSLKPLGSPTSVTRNCIARLNPDSSLDTSFDPNANNVVSSLLVQPDGRILLAGNFVTLRPNGAASAIPRNYLARINADGSVDSTFDPSPNSVPSGLALQINGWVHVVGGFNKLQPNGANPAITRSGYAALKSDGSVAALPFVTPNYSPLCITNLANGRYLIAGQFSTLQSNGDPAPTPRVYVGRLYNDTATSTLTVPDAGTAIWNRSTAGIEVTDVQFQRSTDGGATWLPVGWGTRIGTSANWQITDQHLAVGTLRAVGFTRTGYRNGSSGLIASGTTSYDFDATVTQPPRLLAPTAGARFSETVTVSFTIPETPRNGSVILSLFNDSGAYNLGLVPALQTAGTHTFTFDPLQPAASLKIIAGDAIADGTYTVAISYRDAAGNNIAADLTTGVVIDHPAPVITPPTGGFAPLILVAPASVPNFIASATITHAEGGVVQSPAAGTTLPLGPTPVTITATNIVGETGAYPLTLTTVSRSQDTDGDGLNDASEVELSALGFDWQVNQAALVSTLFTHLDGALANLNGQGIYTADQIRALNVGSPMLTREAGSGSFTLTVGLQQSTDLIHFTPLPLTPSQTTIEADGQLKFRFTTTGNAAFFRVEAR